jgi:hypothetical protein
MAMKVAIGAIAAVLDAFVTPGMAAAQQSALIEVTSANVDQLVSPNAATLTHLIVAVCDSTTPECQDYTKNLTLLAALSQGGWLNGVAGMHTAKFYRIDKSTNAVTALTNACATAGAPALADICDLHLQRIQTATTPMLIMMNLKTGFVQSGPGDVSDQELRQMVVDFLKH